MSIGLLTNLAGSYAESLVSSVLASKKASHTSASGASSVRQTPDVNHLSPFAEILATLQQLQQSSPTQYQQVTQQIATNLTTAANTATSNGNTTAAGMLNQLATDFSNASQHSQLPNIQDLAKAVRHHRRDHVDLDATNAAGSNSGSTSNATSDLLSQLIASYQSTAGANQTTDPMAIITSTLASAGVG